MPVMVEPVLVRSPDGPADPRLPGRRDRPPARDPAAPACGRRGPRRGSCSGLPGSRNLGRPARPLPAPVHRPLARANDRTPQARPAGHRDRHRPQGRQAPTTRQRRSMVTVTLADGTGFLELTFFNQPSGCVHVPRGHGGRRLGIAQLYRGKLQLANQEVEVLRGRRPRPTGRDHPGASRPPRASPRRRSVSSCTGRSNGCLRSPDPMPEEVVAAESLVGLRVERSATSTSPRTTRSWRRRAERLKFDELFTLELGVGYRKQRIAAERKGVSHEPTGALTELLAATVPFEPTKAQRTAMDEVGAAMASPTPMNVLLQGDVGSGKTLVALHACLVAIGSGHQAAIMAPTEVLAGQHALSVGRPPARGRRRAVPDARERDVRRRHVGPGLRCSVRARRSRPSPKPSVTFALLSGAVTGKDRRRVLDGIEDGSVDLVIGTHALVQEAVSFSDLSLAVVDEQHRFGLHQRMALRGKGGGDIDVLIMTATPIPRTLALTYYGDLDVVTLDEMPAGRIPIETRAVRSEPERARRGRPRPPRGRPGPPGVRGLRRHRRGEPLPGEGGRGRGGASAEGGLPRSARRAAPRPDAAQGEGADRWMPSGPARPTC